MKPMNKYKDANYGYKQLTNGKKIFYRRDNYIEREWGKVYLDRWDEDYYKKNKKYVSFTECHVSFIIVKGDKDKNSLIKSIYSIKTIGGNQNKVNQKDKLNLISKIITIEDIKKNF